MVRAMRRVPASGCFLILAVVAGASCSSSAGSDAGTDVVDDSADVGTDTSGEVGDLPSDAPPSSCSQLSCGEHGQCAEDAGVARCQCEPGYDAPDGGPCLNARTVPCKDVTPRDATSIPATVEVTYTTDGGWTQPAECAWSCDGGMLRILDRCVTPGTLEYWCHRACLVSTRTCPSNPPVDASTCEADCLSAIDAPAAAARTICRAVGGVGGVSCGSLWTCDNPVGDPRCVTICDGLAGCSLLNGDLPIGASHGECVLNCDATVTRLNSQDVFPAVVDCMDHVGTSCDPMEAFLCTAWDFPTLCDDLCVGNAATCGSIPDTWADEAACRQACESWTPGQRLFVSACLPGDDGICTTASASRCKAPPAEPAAGSTGLVEAIIDVCPGLFTEEMDVPPEAPYVTQLLAWRLTGSILPNLNLQGMTIDFAAASACVRKNATCPENVPGFIIDCEMAAFIPIPGEIWPGSVEACKVVSPCAAEIGQTFLTETVCQSMVSRMHKDDPQGIETALACATSAASCVEVRACIGMTPIDYSDAACSSLVPCWQAAGTNPLNLAPLTTDSCSQALSSAPGLETLALCVAAAECAGKDACLPTATP